MSAAGRTLPTPKSRSMSRRVRSCRSSCSSWLMASGMESSHLREHGAGLQRQEATEPPGGGVDGFARATSAGRPARQRGPAAVPDWSSASRAPPGAATATRRAATPPARGPGTRGTRRGVSSVAVITLCRKRRIATQARTGEHLHPRSEHDAFDLVDELVRAARAPRSRRRRRRRAAAAAELVAGPRDRLLTAIPTGIRLTEPRPIRPKVAPWAAKPS